jgi:Ca-activated chloride channel family protein
MDADKKAPSPKASQKESASKEAENESSQRMSPKKGSDDQNRKQADRLLNRLKDQPGRATMPAYGDIPVEKNW